MAVLLNWRSPSPCCHNTHLYQSINEQSPPENKQLWRDIMKTAALSWIHALIKGLRLNVLLGCSKLSWWIGPKNLLWLRLRQTRCTTWRLFSAMQARALGPRAVWSHGLLVYTVLSVEVVSSLVMCHTVWAIAGDPLAKLPLTMQLIMFSADSMEMQPIKEESAEIQYSS